MKTIYVNCNMRLSCIISCINCDVINFGKLTNIKLFINTLLSDNLFGDLNKVLDIFVSYMNWILIDLNRVTNNKFNIFSYFQYTILLCIYVYM